MAVQFNDMYQLSQDTVFQNRVQAALTAACIAIQNENPTTTPFHKERSGLATAILTWISGANPYIQLFTNTVSTDTNVTGDATEGGTVPLTAGNRAAQALLVTDAHIAAAISGEFNSFFVS